MIRTDRHNILCNTFGESFWGFGTQLAAPLTVLPILLVALGAKPFEIGILAAINSAGFLVPQLFSSLYLQSGTGRKGFLIWFHFFPLIPLWMLIGATILFLSKDHPLASRVSILLLYSLFIFGIGYILPVWLDWIAGIFKKDLRGTAFGLSSSASAAGGALAALAASLVTDRVDFPNDYGILFLAGGLFFTFSMIVYVFIKPGIKEQTPRLSRGRIFSKFRHSLSDTNFKRYLVSRILLTFGAAPIGFLAVHYQGAEGGSIKDSSVIAAGSLIWITQALFALLLGKLGDIKGHRFGAAAGSLAQAVSIAVAVFIPGLLSCRLAFALTGIGFASAWVSHTNFIFETCPHDSRTAHITISNLVLSPFTIAIPLIAGKAIEIFGTGSVFMMSLIPTLLGTAWLLFFVKNPKIISPADNAV